LRLFKQIVSLYTAISASLVLSSLNASLAPSARAEISPEPAALRPAIPNKPPATGSAIRSKLMKHLRTESETTVQNAEPIWTPGIKPPEKWQVQDAPLIERDATTPLLKSTIIRSDQFESLHGLLDEALLKSPRAASIRANLGITRSQYAYQLMSPNPTFIFDEALLSEGSRRNGPGFAMVSPWQIAYGLLFAKAQVNETKVAILRDLWSLRADVRGAYSDVVIAQETERTTIALLGLAEQTLQTAAKRFQRGVAPEFDVIRSRLAKEQVQLDLEQAQRRVVKTKQRLCLLLGRALKRPIDIPPLSELEKPDSSYATKDDFIPSFAHDVPDVSVFIEQARKHRWDLRDVKQQIALNRRGLKDAYANVMPMPQCAFGQSAGNNLPDAPVGYCTFVTVNAPMPLTNLNQGDIQKFKATIKQLGWQLGASEMDSDIAVSQSYQDFMTYRQRIRLYKEHVLADSMESLRLSQRGYEAGFTGIVAVIQAQQANFQIQLQYIADVQAYQQAYIALERAVGVALQ
jgi:outer membrane protein, heavy metal efflux system